MSDIRDIAALEAVYGAVNKYSLLKVSDHLTAEYAAWIEAAKFCILSTVGLEGTDASPRGDDHAVVRIADAKTLLMPDWRGNNRLDSLRNIVTDGRVSLMFMINGQNSVIRVNGTAILTTDLQLRQSFERKGILPATVIVMTVGEVYSQCARALMRSNLWGDAPALSLPSMGDILSAQTRGNVDGATYDQTWPERAKTTMW